MSKESAHKSFVKEAALVTSASSTPNLSTMIFLTLVAMSDIVNSFCLRRKNILFVKNEVFYLPFCLHILKYPYNVGQFWAF